jgi:hypothetical protein
MSVHILINTLSVVLAFVAGSLISANLFVLVATLLHRRKSAMRFLSHFSRAIMMLRLSDSVTPSRFHRQR